MLCQYCDNQIPGDVRNYPNCVAPVPMQQQIQQQPIIDTAGSSGEKSHRLTLPNVNATNINSATAEPKLRIVYILVYYRSSNSNSS